MPTLAVDGKVICQSQAINRYLANEFGLYGESNEQKAIIDQVTETIQEFVEDYFKLYFNQSLGEEEKVFSSFFKFSTCFLLVTFF